MSTFSSVRSLLLTCLIVVAVSGCERYSLDRQMEGLCAKDGGLRVYERIALSADKFNEYGDPIPGTQSASLEERLGVEYRLEHEFTYLKQGDPVRGEGRLARFKWRVVRVTDSKLLADAVVYGRSGGDFIALGHFSSKVCPERLGAPASVVRSVFVKRSS